MNLKVNINNIKTVKMFNATYSRAGWHKKHKVRAKNYKRARRMLGMPPNKFLNHPRKIWRYLYGMSTISFLQL